jgi:WD40 repeat protein
MEIQTENIGKWSNDASRFLKLRWNSIRENPLTVYHAFVFCPRSSIFHQVYSKMESFPHPIVRIGLDEDWPSSIVARTYKVDTQCLSPLEDILVTGGQRDGLAVYSVWDTKTADGKTFVHPCKTRSCRVLHISFDQSRGNVELRTGCECGKICRWDISYASHSLLEQIQLEHTGRFLWWADDGSKAVIKYNKSKQRSTLFRLSISGTPPVCHGLFKSKLYTHWWFSPGHGDKVVAADLETHALLVWDCSSGHQLFQKSYHFISLPGVCFSPNGEMIAYAFGGVTELFSAEDGTVLRSWDGSKGVKSIFFFPKGDRFIVIDKGIVYLFDGDVLHEKEVRCDVISFSPDGQRVATISDDVVDIFDHTLEEKLEHYDFNPSKSYNRRFSWIHSVLVCIEDDTLSFHYLSHNSRPNLSTHQLPSVERILLSPDNLHLLTLHEDRSIHVWDIKLGQPLNPPDDQITALSGPIRMEYAPDSSCALVWDDSQLMVLQYSAGHIKWIPFVTYSSSKLLAATFFPDSSRILIIDADSNVTSISIQNMSQYSMPRLRSHFTKIRQLVVSPTERLLAICSDSGLIIHGTSQDTGRGPLLSKEVESAVFSPDGAYLYTLEGAGFQYMVSRVDTQSWTIRRVFPGETGSLHSRPKISVSELGSIEFDANMVDGPSALRVSSETCYRHEDMFLGLSTNRRIIPPLSWRKDGQLRYRNRWLMILPTEYSDQVVMNQDHLAYIDRGRSLVLDYYPLIEQM